MAHSTARTRLVNGTELARLTSRNFLGMPIVGLGPSRNIPGKIPGQVLEHSRHERLCRLLAHKNALSLLYNRNHFVYKSMSLFVHVMGSVVQILVTSFRSRLPIHFSVCQPNFSKKATYEWPPHHLVHALISTNIPPANTLLTQNLVFRQCFGQIPSKNIRFSRNAPGPYRCAPQTGRVTILKRSWTLYKNRLRLLGTVKGRRRNGSGEDQNDFK